MPIRGLDTIKKSNTYTWLVKAQAQVLKDSIVAIDGFWFLRKYVVLGNVQDLFISRCDERFIAPVLKLIKMVNKNKFKILWIWDGLDFKRPLFTNDTDNITILKKGYDHLEKQDFKNANHTLKQLIDYEDIVIQINKILDQFSCQYIRAPYSATAQIAYYLRNEICPYAFCKTDTLIFDGVEKIITDLHLDNCEQLMISVFNKKEFIKSYDIGISNFRSLAFVLGCEFCPTIPEYAENFIMENIITIVKTGDIDLYLEEQSKKNKNYSSYLSLFYSAFVLVDYHLIMTEEGQVSFFKESLEIPSDFEEFFGKRLPDMLYEEFFVCKISKGILESLSKNKNPEGLRQLSYKILNSIFPINGITEDFKEDPKYYLTKHFKTFDKFNLELQIISNELIAENAFDTSHLHKVISLVNLNDKLISKNDKIDVKFSYEILEFVYRSNQILRLLKEIVECYELVTKKKSVLKFDIDIHLYSYLYYEQNKNINEDVGIKYTREFISKFSKFVAINKNTSEEYKSIKFL